MVTSDRVECLGPLLLRSWIDYDRLKDHKHIVRPAIPILFFGDSNRYLSSPLRVVTVGLNPSSAEFPTDDRFHRFPAMNDAVADVFHRESLRHLAALDSYFRCNPYKRWFASFEPVLRGMGCSFYDDCDNTALHTDLCSPLATSPTWTRLSPHERAHLESEGLGLWHSLITALAPDVILVSVAQRYLNRINFRALTQREIIWRLDRQRPYEVTATQIQILPTGQQSLLVFGKAAQTPFGKISNVRKAELGALIKTHCISNLT